MILMIDNYDSFTYNLIQYMEQLGASIHVARNNEITVDEIDALALTGIMISPGPGRPESAGITLDLISRYSGRLPILGVCLGHQAIGMAFGAQVVYAKHLKHGKTSMIHADGKRLYQGITGPFQAMRYHSLAISRENLPECLEITSEADDGEIMGLRHRDHMTEGIQFHPESIMTHVGKRLLRNFLSMTTENP
ncbi:MAG TPA: aminodeoxychorismate/anthranilate synthase component II [Desulfatirhabdiaceae bacterium]|nr:aminodeoxychorismate/anthranilate synthase component II [Desulfatirhabdiaceae bacterium]